MLNRTLSSITGIGVYALLIACTPIYDWRELTIDTQLTVWLPCKPETRSRQALLAGQSVPMRLLSCEADGAVWGVLIADVGEPSHASISMHELNQALIANISGAINASTTVKLRGQEPREQALRVQATGRRPSGDAVQLEACVFSRGSHVYHASLTRSIAKPIGSHADQARQSEARDTFFSSLKLSRI